MDVFTALAEPNRRSIIEMLVANGQLPASAIYHRFKISPQAVSQHLKVLRDSKLVKVEKQAQQRIYRVNPAAFAELERWTQQMTAQWEERFKRMDSILKEDSKVVRKEKRSGRAK